MKLGIMQPYFFPYLGYFQLINAVDRWIAFDQVQFIDKGWISRNRILHPNPEKEWQYITLPLSKRGQFDKICDIAIKDDINWRDQILGKLTFYKKKAPHYQQTLEFVRFCFDTNETRLAHLVVEILRKTTNYLNIQTPIELQSEMNLQINKVCHAGQWALRISELLGASEYINPQGGQDIFIPSEFNDSKIKLSFLTPEPSAYSQRRGSFVAGLSIIDVLMFNNHSQCANLLKQYDIF